LATEQYHRAIAEQSAEAQAHFAWQLAKTVGDRGHVRTAARLIREAVAAFRALGRPTFVQNALIALATALALGGDAEEATQALASFDELDLPPAQWTAVELVEARAWTAAAAGDLPRARQLLHEAADLGETIGDLVRAAAALHGLARLGRAAEVEERLTLVASDLEGDLPAARIAHTRALARRQAAGLEEVSEAFETMGAELLAAEAAADAAVVWRGAGNRRRATGANQRAIALADRCEGALTPALRALDVRAELTPAERETALLAAAGRSSKEIAADLILSVRTVENRLQRVYEKLGVSSRAELSRRLQC
jgi:DNA-binding CsgD family transcriptional regulator